ncbi:carbohydrate kinase family protein [Roseinatronobacter alkalisoli]|uniref:PfkB family carbohydrate kinase n=1 Tax=Roseinatronobacter alkalisoli TaxID=3028235 RepID=A0ABT5TD59_9RHOB|nr:PfkB family carbohydrate kinase [Roseinatronobacter sp. HJB301]MDD7973044.1 PfkB family carbohydrate kinase [Roseinatronobacter sp. HJB301]
MTLTASAHWVVPDMQGEVLCAGRIYCDLVFTGLPDFARLGTEVFAGDMSLRAGGGAFITAAHLLDAGTPAHLLGRLGDDEFSNALVTQIRAAGLTTDFLAREHDTAAQVTVALNHAGDRAFVTHRHGPALPPDAARAFDRGRITHVHFSEYATLRDARALADAALARGLVVSLDPSWDAKLLHPEALTDMARGIDLFLPNLKEATVLTGAATAKDALHILGNHFPMVAIKCGANGAWFSQNGRHYHSIAPGVRVLDTTGAGDAFNAGLIAGLMQGLPAQTVLDRAVARGARAVTTIGGAPEHGKEVLT